MPEDYNLNAPSLLCGSTLPIEVCREHRREFLRHYGCPQCLLRAERARQAAERSQATRFLTDAERAALDAAERTAPSPPPPSPPQAGVGGVAEPTLEETAIAPDRLFQIVALALISLLLCYSVGLTVAFLTLWNAGGPR